MKDLSMRVSAITERLEKGEGSTGIAKEFAQRWAVSERTVKTCIAIAKANLAERNKAKQAIIEEVRKEAIAKVAQEGIISDLELEAQLCAIAMGELEIEKTVIQNGVEKTIKCKPTPFDMVLAIDKLWKKRGSYPVEKPHTENQTLILQYNLQKPEDIKYIDGVVE
jgi:hypothetical protein